ncbi:MAG: recombinase family protein [Rhodospirillales bacterium]|nr:recombinase family protein [Rhodospirillales bacterium]
MNGSPFYTFRTGKDELFLSAPNDDLHQQIIPIIASNSYYDRVLEEWRVPWAGDNPEVFIARLRKSVSSFNSGIPSQIDTPSNGQVYGYAQTTKGEAAELQIDALRETGIPDERIFYEKLAARNPKRHKLVECIDTLEAGDILVVLNLFSLSRSLRQLAETTRAISEKGAFLRCLDEPIDTSLPKFEHFIEHILYAAEFEKKALSSRTKEGLKAAHSMGHSGGRTKGLTKENLKLVSTLALNGMSGSEISRIVGISRSGLYRNVPGGPRSFEKAYKLEGKAGIEKLINALAQQIEAGLSFDQRDEINQLFEQGNSIKKISGITKYNEETIRNAIICYGTLSI